MTEQPTPKKPFWRRFTRIALWTIGSLAALIILAYLGLAAYVHTNSNKILAEITEQLNETTEGTVMIESMEPTLVEDFPNISVALKNVVLRDSLYGRDHRVELVHMERVFVAVKPLSLFTGRLVVPSIRLRNGVICLFTNANGFSNSYLFRSKDSTKKTGNTPSIRTVVFENVKLKIDNAPKNKLFTMDVKKLVADLDWPVGKILIDISTETKIGKLAFNETRGSFLTNKLLEADLHAEYDKSKRLLSVAEQEISIDGDAINIAADFSFQDEPPAFTLKIGADKILYSHALAMVSQNISSKLRAIDMTEPLSLRATIAGHIQYRDTPTVKMVWKVEDNTLIVPGREFKNCSFSGSFSNEYISGQGHADKNSEIAIRNFHAETFDIPVEIDSAQIVNLIVPHMYAHIRSKFKAAAINNITGAKTLHVDEGKASLDVVYNGGLSLTDHYRPTLNGTLNLTDASATYVPRGLKVRKMQAALVFAGTDIRIPKVHLESGQTVINMSGLAKNILGALHNPAEPASLTWNVRSPLLNAADFIAFAGVRKPSAPSTKSAGTSAESPIADRLDAVLNAASAHVSAEVGAVVYKHFRAEDVKALADLNNDGVNLNKVFLRHAGGTIELAGRTTLTDNGGKFDVKAKVQTVRVAEFFKAFDNFNQDAITASNLRGNISVDVNASGRLKSTAEIVPKSLIGTVHFDLRNGALVHLDALEKVGKYIFKKRNLSEVTFERISNTLRVEEQKVVIEPMSIHSSALHVDLYGIYGLVKGTDIRVRAPLGNPKKEEVQFDQEGAEEPRGNGIVIYLRAKDEDGSGVKLGLDWRGKAYKEGLNGFQQASSGGAITSAP